MKEDCYIMNELSKDRAYSILFIADYSRAQKAWRGYVDIIINNLLDKPIEPNAGWTKYKNLPPISVSIVDKAETKQQAFEKLKSSRYDVVFINNYLNGDPIGAGMLKRFRQYQPDALYIPLLNLEQKKGVIKKDGTISTGKGIEAIFNKGFYSSLFKNKMNITVIINLIKAGGRSREDAFRYYGLDYEFSLAADNKENISSNEVPQQSMDQIGKDKKDNSYNESARIAGQMVSGTQVVGSDRGSETVMEETVQTGERPLNRKERRRREREKRIAEQDGMPAEIAASMPQHSDVIQPEVTKNMSYESTAAPDVVESSHLQKDDGILEKTSGVNENMRVMQERGQLNAGLAMTGTLHGHVMFAKGNTVWVELDKELDQVGLNFTDIYNSPVVIPYAKFGNID